MGTWVELRCEERSDEVEGVGNIGERCFTADNAGPMGMADDNRADLLELMRSLEQDARDGGWLKKRAGWVCPFCVRHPPKSTTPGEPQ
jgi:hypothetical protein